MKVYINKYRNHWLSPYSIMEKVLFWKKWTDRIFEVSQRDKDGRPMSYTDIPGPNDTYKMDTEGLNKHRARMDNGLRLFGKYYSGLWD